MSSVTSQLVARDGIEPPTPAFSGPPTEMAKWFEITALFLNAKHLWSRGIRASETLPREGDSKAADKNGDGVTFEPDEALM